MGKHKNILASRCGTTRKIHYLVVQKTEHSIQTDNQTTSFSKYKCPLILLGNAETSEKPLKRAHLQCENTVIRDGIDGSPEVLIQEAYDAHDALNRVEARRLLKVAKHDIVLSIANRPTENGVCVAPYDVGARKGGSSPGGPSSHRVDSLEAKRVGVEDGEKCGWGTGACGIVVGCLIGDLCHGQHGVTKRSLGNVREIRRVTSAPFRECLLVESGPDLSVRIQYILIPRL